MTNPAQGLSAGPLLLAVVALVAASVSFVLQAGASRRSNEPATTTARVRDPAAGNEQRRPTEYRRVAGPVTTLAPAGDATGKDVGVSSALCPAGTRAVSGGFRTLTGGGETFYSDVLTKDRVAWAVVAANNVATSGTVQAFAYCVRSGSRRRDARALTRQRAAGRREMKALLDRYKALRAAQL